MNDGPPSPWTETAATLPLAFAQVREDPQLDLSVVQQLPASATVVMIASGGETACCLSRSAIRRLHLIDMNPAQIALTKLKLRCLEQLSLNQRLQLLGHATLQGTRASRPRAEDVLRMRSQLLTEHLEKLNLPANVLGPLEFVAQAGPDHAGRYEYVFRELAQFLKPQREPLTRLLGSADTIEGARLLETLQPHLEMALAAVMSLPNLVRLFGLEATRNPVKPFAEHFADRTGLALNQPNAPTNPFLWQMLLGQFPDGHIYDWLRLESPARPEIIFTIGKMREVLSGLASSSCDLVHLSNILDWLSPDEATTTLQAAGNALKPGGHVLIRQLNSTLDIPALPSEFQWDQAAGVQLLRRDRSFFYKAIHWGRKP